VPENQWREAHILVLFSTFKNLSDVMHAGRNKKVVIEQLKSHVQENVYETLKLFWKELFPKDPAFMNMDELDVHNKNLLISDLDSYYQDIVTDISNHEKAKILLLETEIDEITVSTQKKQMAELFGKVDAYHNFDFIGHGFAYAKAKECFDFLKKKLSIF
jgi:Mg2+/Co2+ transporter CorB